MEIILGANETCFLQIQNLCYRKVEILSLK